MRIVAPILAILLGATQAQAACTPGDPRFAGHYWLEGEREVGSELLLAPDGRFEFALAYGANDQYGRGCWSVREGRMTLLPQGRRRVPALHSPDVRGFRGMVLLVGPDGDLRWPLPGFRGVFRKGG